jgi:predicted dinucleotide-binding enzyme
MKKVAVLGSGQVGEALANGFLKHGFQAMRASRTPNKLETWKSNAKSGALIGTPAEAAAWGEVIVLAVKGAFAEAALDEAGLENLEGKLVIDTTNPIGDEPPNNGVIRYFTSQNDSLMERLQRKAPHAKFVKAFNSVGNMFMVDPPFKPVPTMFICGNDKAAKKTTGDILAKFGWEAADMGAVEVARPIEALCQLWCAPGIASNEWAHAFKYIKLG